MVFFMMTLAIALGKKTPHIFFLVNRVSAICSLTQSKNFSFHKRYYYEAVATQASGECIDNLIMKEPATKATVTCLLIACLTKHKNFCSLL